jgi:hypothetical protein
MNSSSSVFVNWLCAAFCNFVQMLAVAMAVAYAGWIILGWLAAWMLWGSAGGGAALALWLASVLASIWLVIREQFELKLDQLDSCIEAKARSWKNR